MSARNTVKLGKSRGVAKSAVYTPVDVPINYMVNTPTNDWRWARDRDVVISTDMGRATSGSELTTEECELAIMGFLPRTSGIYRYWKLAIFSNPSNGLRRNLFCMVTILDASVIARYQVQNRLAHESRRFCVWNTAMHHILHILDETQGDEHVTHA